MTAERLTFGTPADLLEAVGKTAGPTPWMAVEQVRINHFADATDDHQWIHVDEEKSKDGPFGAAVAHGYLTLSLASKFLPELVRIEKSSMGLNYGCEKVRFPNVVRAGARLRGHAEIIAASEMKGGIQVTVRITIEVEGEARPACVVDTVTRYYP